MKLRRSRTAPQAVGSDVRRPVLQLIRVNRTHGAGATEVVSLCDADLTVEAGEFVAIMGPSGSGKSTLLNLAGGLDVATAGEVLVEGADLGGMRVSERAVLRRRSIGYVFQDFNLLPALTAVENVSFPLELDGWSLRHAHAAARSVLDEVGVANLADRRPEDMSGKLNVWRSHERWSVLGDSCWRMNLPERWIPRPGPGFCTCCANARTAEHRW